MIQRELFDYVMNTPHNTNPAILKQKIKDISGASSWNDLADRPFGESENAVLLPETELFPYEHLELPDGSWVNTFVAPRPIEFVAGETYTVNWNGTDYETVSLMGVNPMAGSLAPVVGNPALLGGENNNLPFIIGGDATGILAAALDGSTSVVVSVKGYKIERLPEKYIPIQEPYVYEKGINEFRENSTDKTFHRTEPQLPLALLEAISQRKPIYMKVRTKKDDGTYDNGEFNGPVSFAGNYEYIGLGLMLADKTSEIFKIPEGTVYNGEEITTQQLLIFMGIRISARFPYYMNKCEDFLVWFIDAEGLD